MSLCLGRDVKVIYLFYQEMCVCMLNIYLPNVQSHADTPSGKKSSFALSVNSANSDHIILRVGWDGCSPVELRGVSISYSEPNVSNLDLIRSVDCQCCGEYIQTLATFNQQSLSPETKPSQEKQIPHWALSDLNHPDRRGWKPLHENCRWVQESGICMLRENSTGKRHVHSGVILVSLVLLCLKCYLMLSL